MLTKEEKDMFFFAVGIDGSREKRYLEIEAGDNFAIIVDSGQSNGFSSEPLQAFYCGNHEICKKLLEIFGNDVSWMAGRNLENIQWISVCFKRHKV